MKSSMLSSDSGYPCRHRLAVLFNGVPGILILPRPRPWRSCRMRFWAQTRPGERPKTLAAFWTLNSFKETWDRTDGRTRRYFRMHQDQIAVE